jgi:predicted GIY-YIG superfamily endonuclease
MFFVYAIISVSSKRIYIGHTKDPNQRLAYHNSVYVKSTAKDVPWKLLAVEQTISRSEARWIERQLKNSKGKRTKWIELNRVER